MLILHDPDARLDYRFDFAAWLGDDTIDTTTVVASPATGVTVETPEVQDDTDVVVFVSVADTVTGTVALTCHITTTAGREDDRTMRLRIRER